MERIFCQGCGALIQTTDPSQTGYAPETALKNENMLCKRCFRLKNYNEPPPVSFSDDDYRQMIGELQQKKGLIVHVVDIFDVDGTLMDNLKQFTGNNPVLLVANKVDLLPKSTNRQKLKEWLRSIVKKSGLHIQDICLISSKTSEGFHHFKKSIAQYRNRNDVYIVGVTNTGKSTLVNRLVKESTETGDVITTSYFPGTTLGFIEIPLEETSVLVDTPGIINRKSIAHYLSHSDLKAITPKKEVKPRTYQLTEQQTLFFGGLARIDVIKGNDKSLICFFSKELLIHRTKLQKADQLYANHTGELLSPPDETSKDRLPELTEHTFQLTSDKVDIVFAGLGWVSLPHGNMTVRAHYPNGLSVSTRPSIL